MRQHLISFKKRQACSGRYLIVHPAKKQALLALAKEMAAGHGSALEIAILRDLASVSILTEDGWEEAFAD